MYKLRLNITLDETSKDIIFSSRTDSPFEARAFLRQINELHKTYPTGRNYEARVILDDRDLTMENLEDFCRDAAT